MPLYFFGAQGADFCFLHPNSNALGRRMHRGCYDFFNVAAALASNSASLLAYSLGYATHYAADCVFHPFVYRLSGKSLLKHSQVERAIDRYFRLADDRPDPFRSFFRPKLLESDVNEVFLVYAAYAAKTGAKPLSRAAFSSAISLFNAYTGSPFPRSTNLDKAILENREKRFWTHPNAPELKSADGVNELYRKALYESEAYVLELHTAIKEKRPPSRKTFSKNFLSGL